MKTAAHKPTMSTLRHTISAIKPGVWMRGVSKMLATNNDPQNKTGK